MHVAQPKSTSPICWTIQSISHPGSRRFPTSTDPNFGHELEAYYTKRDACWADLEKYDALLLPGGSGPMVDMVNNERLHDVILGFLAQDKLIAAECYCVTCLAFARDWTERKSIIWGKHVTGHAREYDYKDGTGFAQTYGFDGEPMNSTPILARPSIRWNTFCVTPLDRMASTTAALDTRFRPSWTIPS